MRTTPLTRIAHARSGLCRSEEVELIPNRKKQRYFSKGKYRIEVVTSFVNRYSIPPDASYAGAGKVRRWWHMARDTSRLSSSLTALLQHAVKLRSDRNGSVAVMMGALLPVLVGTIGLGFEVSNWYRVNRSMQNAADAAAIAAATNGRSNYDVEAKAVTAQYGFTDGTNHVTVVASNAAACPAGGNTCYSVTVTGLVPLFLSEVVGFKGTSTVNGVAQRTLSAKAVATQSSTAVQLCLLALGKSGAQDIVTNGNPNADMTGCSVMANTSATCNGSNLKADWGLAHGTDNGCGVHEASGVPQVSDPYDSYKSNIPANPCASYPGTNLSTWPPSGAAVHVSGNTYTVCGNLTLSGTSKTVTVPAGKTLVIEHGNLDTGGHNTNDGNTLKGSNLTVVFSGPSGTAAGGPTGHGTFDIAAPTSAASVWRGVAMYQDPALTAINTVSAGNSPTWDVSGLVYLPYSNITLSGAVNKSSNSSYHCFILVVDQITINGTGDITQMKNSDCNSAFGSSFMPTATTPGRGLLVL
jgi:Flp pilus assembly protein TadG